MATRGRAISEAERKHAVKLLTQGRWTKAEVARLTGLSLSTIHKLAKQRVEEEDA